ncbi:MAG: Fic family protein [Fusobacteriaceae bacterium]
MKKIKIIKLRDSYFRHIKIRYPKIHNDNTGIHLFLEGFFIYIPITSQIREATRIYDHDERYLYIKDEKGKKIGTLLIEDYVYVKPHLIETIKIENKNEKKFRLWVKEIIFLNKNINEIEIKFLKIRNRSLKGNDYNKMVFLKNFSDTFIYKNRKEAEKYLEKAIASMAILENLEININNLKFVIEQKTFENNFIYEAKVFIDLSEAWNYMKTTLDEPLTLEYIIDINARLAKNQALSVGELRNQKNTVTSEYIEVDIPDKEDLKDFLNHNLSKTKNVEENILKLFCHIITKQWFWDGNKRTAFIIANKLFIERGLGILILSEENKDEFIIKLLDYYVNKDSKEFLFFLREKCLVAWN